MAKSKKWHPSTPHPLSLPIKPASPEALDPKPVTDSQPSITSFFNKWRNSTPLRESWDEEKRLRAAFNRD
jgi:hypothetical protein